MNENPSKEPRHRKLGAVVPPEDTTFCLRLRMPHWAPDQLTHGEGTPSQRDEELYVEEALKAVAISGGALGRDPFQPPLTELGGAWVLGKTDWVPQMGRSFDDWLSEVCCLARQYNVALYRLRKGHLEHKKHGSMQSLPGEPTSLPPAEAERLYCVAMGELRRKLEERTADGKARVADMVQINGYIVSVRAIDGIYDGLPSSPGQMKTLGPQPGGSDSSHVYLSSPFYSSR